MIRGGAAVAIASSVAASGLLLLAGSLSASKADRRDPPTDAVEASEGHYVQPNVTLENGQRAYFHVTPEDKPWRVAIGRPKRPPKYGSSTRAREVSIEAMKMWETAIQARLQWFDLEFVEEDADAPVQVVWKRRITGPWGGFGRMRLRALEGGGMRLGGEMQISTTPDRFSQLSVDQVRLLVAHEFGHVLGLRHCLKCDSAMNYAWNTRDRVLVTDLDVETFVRLVQIPNGTPAE